MKTWTLQWLWNGILIGFCVRLGLDVGPVAIYDCSDVYEKFFSMNTGLLAMIFPVNIGICVAESYAIIGKSLKCSLEFIHVYLVCQKPN